MPGPAWSLRQPFRLVARYRDLPAAWLAQTILESAGIEPFLADENYIGLNWFLSDALGNVKLWVRTTDAEDAVEILAHPIPDSTTTGDFSNPICPACGSLNISFNGYDKPHDYLNCLFRPAAPLNRSYWHCDLCSTEWLESTSRPPASFSTLLSAIFIIGLLAAHIALTLGSILLAIWRLILYFLG